MTTMPPLPSYRGIPVENIRWTPMGILCPMCEHPLFAEVDKETLQPLQVACPRCDYSIYDERARPLGGLTETQRLERLRSTYRSICSAVTHRTMVNTSHNRAWQNQDPDIDPPI